MLSYRHGYHAGNPADVFKHAALVTLVRTMQVKPGPIRFVDTHAGAAWYDLTSETAQKTREYEAGIGRLWRQSGEPGPLDDYLAQVRRCNSDRDLRYYPGSPVLLRHLLRPQDRLVLCERHPAEQAILQTRFSSDRHVRLVAGDGYATLAGLAPPPGGRGLVLIDPSWELRSEITDMTAALERALARFGHGVYAIWYPTIEGRDIKISDLPTTLGLEGERWLDLAIEFPAAQRLGRMTGCGMAIINCPWRARAPLNDVRTAVTEEPSPAPKGMSAYQSDPG